MKVPIKHGSVSKSYCGLRAFSLPEQMVSIGLSSLLILSMWLMLGLFQERAKGHKQKQEEIEGFQYWNLLIQNDLRMSHMIVKADKGFLLKNGSSQVRYQMGESFFFRETESNYDSLEIPGGKVCWSENKFGLINGIRIAGVIRDSVPFIIQVKKHYSAREMLVAKSLDSNDGI